MVTGTRRRKLEDSPNIWMRDIFSHRRAQENSSLRCLDWISSLIQINDFFQIHNVLLDIPFVKIFYFLVEK